MASRASSRWPGGPRSACRQGRIGAQGLQPHPQQALQIRALSLVHREQLHQSSGAQALLLEPAQAPLQLRIPEGPGQQVRQLTQAPLAGFQLGFRAVALLLQVPQGFLEDLGLPALLQGAVLGPLQLGLQALQGASHGGGLCQQAIQARGPNGLFVVEGVQPTFQLGDLALETQPLPLAHQGLLLAGGLLILQPLEARLLVTQGPLGQGHRFIRRCQSGLTGRQASAGFQDHGLEGGEGVPGFGQPVRQGVDPLAETLPLGLSLFPALHLKAALLLRQLQPLIEPQHGGGSAGLGLLLLIHGQPQGLDLGGLLGDLGGELSDPPFGLVQLIQDALLGGLQLHGLARQQDALGGLDLAVQFLGLPGPGGLSAQGLHLLVELKEDVIQPLQVGAGLVQAALGLAAAQLVAGDAGGLFQQQPAVLGATTEDEIDLSLLNEAVGPGTHARVEEQILDILEAGLPAIDAVLAPRVPIEPAGDAHLADRSGQGGIWHLQDQLHLSQAHGSPLGGAAKDHVGHLRAPEHGGPLLAQHPGQAVRNIGLAAAIRPHHRRHAPREAELLGIGEGLESVEFEGDQAHRVSAPERGWGTFLSIIP